MTQRIIFSVDYHDRQCTIRRLTLPTREERVSVVATEPSAINKMVDEARQDVGADGLVTWIQESTTGWARAQALLTDRCEFLLVNVLQMPLAPKAHRRKTDKVDTARIQREYLSGALPLSHQPSPEWRRRRRLVCWRENLVRRQTSLRNWINRYLAHETWFDRTGLWSAKGQQRLQTLLKSLPASDALIIRRKLQELAAIERQLERAVQEIAKLYSAWPEAQRLAAIRGISVVSAVSIVTRIAPIERFPTAESLINYAGLSPGVHQSDQTRRCGRIGGGDTDKNLRHYLIQATPWARQIPRYGRTYMQVRRRRGSKVARLVVARMLVRGIYKVLRDGVAFDPGGEPAPRRLKLRKQACS
jgi:transposase